MTEAKCTRSIRTALAFSDYEAVHSVGPDSDRLPVAMKSSRDRAVLLGQAKTEGLRMLSHVHANTRTCILTRKPSHTHVNTLAHIRFCKQHAGTYTHTHLPAYTHIHAVTFKRMFTYIPRSGTAGRAWLQRKDSLMHASRQVL